jgi:putative nucleotidyltransferase with HDIG domain
MIALAAIVTAVIAALGVVFMRRQRAAPSGPLPKRVTVPKPIADARVTDPTRRRVSNPGAPRPSGGGTGAEPSPQAMPEASPACKKFLRQVEELGAIPGMASRLLQMLDDPKTSTDAIGQEVCRDQGLMSMVLRMGNSAIYGASGQVRDITEAIVVLGYDTTRQIVLGRLSRQVLRKNDDWQKALWRHALATALGAQVCARAVKGVTIAHAFTGGLLHDIGKAVMHEASPDQCVQVWRRVAQEGCPSADAELDHFGTDHTEVGAELLKTWNFPQIYQHAARYHAYRAKAVAVSPKEQRLVSIVALGGAVASSMGYDAIPDRSGVEAHEHPAIAQLLASPSLVDTMKAHVEKELAGLAEVFG